MPDINSLPVELLLMIGDQLDSQGSLLTLSQVNRRFIAICHKALLHRNTQEYDCRGLAWAAWEGRLDLVKRFIQAGADPNVKVEDQHKKSARWTVSIKSIPVPDYTYRDSALHLAVFKGHEDIAVYLLEHGGDPSAVGAQWKSGNVLWMANQELSPPVLAKLRDMGFEDYPRRFIPWTFMPVLLVERGS
ncbi:hypothetical protein BDW74DRAFT_181013 [Aspergillus multicolor]|uniref:uncharacterized protein n=1 Tax=Aspergillus multicolor TaxID=41759 RepID=UPI003CCD19DE